MVVLYSILLYPLLKSQTVFRLFYWKGKICNNTADTECTLITRNHIADCTLERMWVGGRVDRRNYYHCHCPSAYSVYMNEFIRDAIIVIFIRRQVNRIVVFVVFDANKGRPLCGADLTRFASPMLLFAVRFLISRFGGAFSILVHCNFDGNFAKCRCKRFAGISGRRLCKFLLYWVLIAVVKSW